MQRLVTALILSFLVSCHSAVAASYIGIYEIRCKKSTDTPKKVRNVAEQIVSNLGLKFDDIVDDGLALNLTVRQIYGKADRARPGLVFSYVSVPGNIWNITITKEGIDEDRLLQLMRERIEKILSAQVGTEWSFSVAHHSFAKP